MEKGESDATGQGIFEEVGIEKHQDGDGSGPATKAGSGHCFICSEKGEGEATWPPHFRVRGRRSGWVRDLPEGLASYLQSQGV
jgi:hypothetical protein